MDKLLKYIAGEANDAEKKEIERQLKADKNAQKEAEQLKKIWENAPKSEPVPVDTDKAWQKVQQRIETQNPASKKIKITRKKRTRWRSLSRVAAVVCLGIGLGYLVYNQYFKTEETQMLAEISENSIKNLTLADGSKITLNKNSKLTYPKEFNGDLREVTLEGEAFFEIQRNEKKPFIIQAGATEVKVLGTKFNVSTRKVDSVEVAVESGKVAFYSTEKTKKSKVILTKGEKGIYAQKAEKMAEMTNENLNSVAWKTKLLRFENTPMWEVSKNLGEFYGVNISVAESLKSCQLTAKFSDKSLDEVLETIGFMFDAKSEKSENQIILTGGNCSE